MTREEAIGNLTHAIRWNDMPQREAIEMAIKALEQRWIPVKTRPITPDEIEEFGWEDKDESWLWMYDCELPDDGREVLIQSEYGIDFTTFYNEGSEGCYFENYEDRGDVIAWMPLPEPYKAESNLDGDPVDIDKAVEHYEKTLETLKGIDLEDKT